LDQAIGQGGFAVIDVGDDRKIADLIHAHGGERPRSTSGAAARPRRAATGFKSSVGARRRRSAGAKKRHVEEMTRLPTKRMATACWDFIVFKSPLRKAPRGLDFSALQRANKIFVHR
jgi:hypothetical protein